MRADPATRAAPGPGTAGGQAPGRRAGAPGPAAVRTWARQPRTTRAAKRAVDLLAAAILLAICLPVLIAACLAIVAETPGSPLYLQWRSGLGGRPFRIIKLRTMLAGADRIGPALTQDGDPRITRVGSLLRRWSLDELPQLLNVLAGRMSLVGPRPELVPIVAGYSPRQRHVLQARPGLTGWAQVNGRDDLSIPDKLELDLYYLAHRTLRWDLAIMARTVRVIATGQGTKR
ncbi:MAG: sugar transferase [Actinomycetota bacterium]|nr:sugar transferase [Actinomycetota bacterium]